MKNEGNGQNKILKRVLCSFSSEKLQKLLSVYFK